MEEHPLHFALKQFFAGQGLPVRGARYLAAVSGGLDSVVLAQLCREAGMDIVIAHANFGLRGAESNRDEDFVKELAAALGYPFQSRFLDAAAYAAHHKCAVQEAARELRYAWFDALRRDCGCTHTLLAHHANDAVETMVMHFFRGTGLQGLASMPPVHREKKLLRPLLGVSRADIYTYAREKELQWVEDSSNLSDKYTRNFIRHKVLPLVAQVYPEADGNLQRNLERFRKTAAFYTASMQKLKESLYEYSGDTIRIPVLKWKQHLHTPLTYEIIRDFGFGEKQVEDVLRLLDGPTGKFIENDQFQLIRHRKWMVAAPKKERAGLVAIGAGAEAVSFGGGQLQLKMHTAASFTPDPRVACLDASDIRFPLVLRQWKAGDYFYPLGMRKKKKLARFFIDCRLSKAEKENTWVLESDRRIIWIIGHRIDDRFRITPRTKEVLQVSWTSPSAGDKTARPR